MFRLAKYIYNLGRRQAYSEILAKLETLSVKLPHNREGQNLRQPVNETIAELKQKLEEGSNE